MTWQAGAFYFWARGGYIPVAIPIPLFGIVSNGQAWQFFRLTAEGRLFEAEPYTTRHLAELLGVLALVCGECAENVPAVRPPEPLQPAA